MPKTGVFTLVGPNEGRTMVILEKYPFTNGVFKTPAVYAPLMARMLVPYYSCVLSYEGDDNVPSVEDETVGDDASLAVSSTRGQTVGQVMESKAMQDMLAAAKRLEDLERETAEAKAAEQDRLDAAQKAEAEAKILAEAIALAAAGAKEPPKDEDDE